MRSPAYHINRWIKRRFYRNYQGYFGLKRHFGQRLTRTAWLLALGLIFASAMGADPNQTMAYQTFTFLASLALISLLLVRINRPKISVRRHLPQFASAGTPVRYRMDIHNLTKRKENGLVLFDEPADPRPTFDEFMTIPEPGEEKRNWFDRWQGFYRWLWLYERNLRASVSEVPVPTLLPHGTMSVELELTPLRRGILRFAGATIAAPDPFGLFRALLRLPLAEHLTVLPKRYPISKLPLPGSVKYQQGGVALASAVGQSDEFVALRDYRPGDPLRHIHWRSWARTGKPIIKEFQDEFFVRHAMVLDTFVTEVSSEPFEEAVSLAASFACTLQTQESLLDLMFVGPQAYCFTSGRSLAHQEQMLEILATVQICQDQPFEKLTHLALDHAGTLSGALMIFLEWDDRRRELVRRLQSAGVPVEIFVIAEPDKVQQAASNPGSVDPAHFHVLESGRVGEQLIALGL